MAIYRPIDERGRNWSVQAPYNPEVVDALKKLPQRMWDAERKAWLFTVRTADQAIVALNALREAHAVPAPAQIVEALQRGVVDLDAFMIRAKAITTSLRQRNLRLFDYQLDGVYWMSSRRSGLLCDEMGLGKTIQALVMLPENSRVVVICPSTLKLNWQAETEQWRPDIQPHVLIGRGSFRWPKPGHMAIINYDILPSKAKPAPEGTVMIIDEAHYAKNEQSNRTRACRDLVRSVLANNGFAFGLTGTPLLSRPPDLWTLLMIFDLAETAFPGGFREFAEACSAGRDEHGYWSWGTPDESVAESLRPVMLRRERETVLPELPKKFRTMLRVKINSAGRALIDQAIKECRLTIEQLKNMRFGGEDKGFEDYSRIRRALASAKIPALLDIVKEYENAQEPLVVFSAHRAPVETLGKRDGWATITGRISMSDRQEAVKQFQAGRLRGIAIVIRAGGTGITLTRGCHAVFVDQEWNPGANEQAEDRLYRIGQERSVHFRYLVSNHWMDLAVNEILDSKREVIERVVKETPRAVTLQSIHARRKRLEDAMAEADADLERSKEEALYGIKNGVIYCPACWRMGNRSPLGVYTVTKQTKNKGRKFSRCDFHGYWVWLDDKRAVDNCLNRITDLVKRSNAPTTIIEYEDYADLASWLIKAIEDGAVNPKQGRGLLFRLELNDQDPALYQQIRRLKSGLDR